MRGSVYTSSSSVGIVQPGVGTTVPTVGAIGSYPVCALSWWYVVHDPLPGIRGGKAAWTGSGALNDARKSAPTSARLRTFSLLIEIPPPPNFGTSNSRQRCFLPGGAHQGNRSKFSVSSGLDRQVDFPQTRDRFEAAAVVGGSHPCAADRRRRLCNARPRHSPCECPRGRVSAKPAGLRTRQLP